MKNLLIIITTILSFTATAQTATEIEMITMVNQVRTNPKSFIPVIEEYIESAKKLKALGGGVKANGKPVDVIAEANALIRFLKTVKPVNALELSVATYSITKTHANFLDNTKQVTHTNAKGESYAKRLKPLGLIGGENCTTGNNTKQAMLLFLLDINASVKGHRDNIFNPNFTKLSVGNTGRYWVQDFTN